MTKLNFKEILNKVVFDFIPVINLKTNEIYGYKIAKNFSNTGFSSSEEVYSLASENGLFEFFTLKLQEKSYKLALEKGFSEKKLFYTLRVDYIDDPDFFFESVKNLISNFDIPLENLIYEIKGIHGWDSISDFLNYFDDDSPLLFKESKIDSSSLNVIENMDPRFIEVSSIESLKILKSKKNIKSNIIFKIKEEISKDELLSLGVDFIYKH